MYIAACQGQTTLEDTILMSTETTCYFDHLLQVSKTISFKSNFIQFFHYFIHKYSPGAGADNLGDEILMSKEHLVTSVICCKFKKKQSL